TAKNDVEADDELNFPSDVKNTIDYDSVSNEIKEKIAFTPE
ncbi:4017_t:CDS:2, partial [Paraglomus occultum]